MDRTSVHIHCSLRPKIHLVMVSSCSLSVFCCLLPNRWTKKNFGRQSCTKQATIYAMGCYTSTTSFARITSDWALWWFTLPPSVSRVASIAQYGRSQKSICTLRMIKMIMASQCVTKHTVVGLEGGEFLLHPEANASWSGSRTTIQLYAIVELSRTSKGNRGSETVSSEPSVRLARWQQGTYKAMRVVMAMTRCWKW